MDRLLQLHPHLNFKLKSSRIARYYCVVVILLSWLAIGLADLFLFVQVLLIVVVGMYGRHAIQQLRTLPISSLECRNKNWSVRISEDLHAVALQKNIFVGAGIIALSLKLPTGKKMRVVLWPDSAEADSLRRLRAVLFSQ